MNQGDQEASNQGVTQYKLSQVTDSCMPKRGKMKKKNLQSNHMC